MMELYVLLLMLSLPTLSQADCTAQCLRCAQQISDLDSAVNRLTCTLECEGAVSSTGTLDRCEKILQKLSDELSDLSIEEDGERSEEDVEAPAASNLVKRYGGFIKRIDKNKKKLFAPWKENAALKGMFAQKYGESLSKLRERDVPSITGDEEGEDIAAENETGLYDNNLPLNEVKRYGGFLRKFGPKRSDVDDASRQVLQKRYGGFLRRIRPKLRWDNQKRYGGFLRRHFKISVRSDEEPSSYEDYGL
ncbi:proenkephalin-B [Triplophysa rosa]|uniref:Proenkephalin-B n=1 Tax=Triplophysa rosa TaxID=992332 RepID=A0A9W7WCU2_TRIRA|nr:proenkephalin-B [Triplophysa rosa]KAI7794505.1 putative proenkephalin-B [Triplophysa rosa]